MDRDNYAVESIAAGFDLVPTVANMSDHEVATGICICSSHWLESTEWTQRDRHIGDAFIIDHDATADDSHAK